MLRHSEVEAKHCTTVVHITNNPSTHLSCSSRIETDHSNNLQVWNSGWSPMVRMRQNVAV